MILSKIREAIINHPSNKSFTKKGWFPVYAAHKNAKVLIIGQAPSRLAQEGGTPWDDPSGDNLRNWLGVTKEEFYDEKKFAFLPMDFYFPGSKDRGDMPPRKGFAELWHPSILENLTNIKLTILIGQYSQKLYLGSRSKKNLTDTVRAHNEYLPEFLPLVHPSPRNNIWQKKNPWFKRDVIPKLQEKIRALV